MFLVPCSWFKMSKIDAGYVEKNQHVKILKNQSISVQTPKFNAYRL